MLVDFLSLLLHSANIDGKKMNKIILFVFILSGVRCQCEEDQENIIKIIQPSRLNIQVILDVGPLSRYPRQYLSF